MPLELIPILALVAMFVAATLLPINMGTLGFVAAFLVGTLAVGMKADDIIAGFPSDLFLTLVGVTYLFAIAQNNGTVDLMVRGAVRLVRGRVAFIPWVMFGITGLLTAFGALGPAAVAIIAPIALGFAKRYRINPLLMGMMVIHGAQAGGFSPISIYGVTVNNIVAKAELLNSPLALFLGSLFFNAGIGVLLFVFLGGRSLIGRTVHDIESDADGSTEPDAVGGPGSSGNGTGGTATATIAAKKIDPGVAVKPLPTRSVTVRPGPHPDRAGRAGRVLAGSRLGRGFRLDDRGRRPGAGVAQGAEGSGIPDQLVDRPADRRGADLRGCAAGSGQRRMGR